MQGSLQAYIRFEARCRNVEKCASQTFCYIAENCTAPIQSHGESISPCFAFSSLKSWCNAYETNVTSLFLNY